MWPGCNAGIPNDFVWIFAGGIPPNDFLKSINIQFGTMDVTLEAAAKPDRHIAGEIVCMKFRMRLGNWKLWTAAIPLVVVVVRSW